MHLMLAILAGCGGDTGKLVVRPLAIDWGEIDFQQTVPEGGFDVREVTVDNVGDTALEVTVGDFDFDRLCLEGFASGPVGLGELAPGDQYLLFVGVCGYQVGDDPRDVAIAGSMSFEHAGATSPDVVEWTFTPVRNLDDPFDTGR